MEKQIKICSFLILVFFTVFSSHICSQSVSSELLTHEWPAKWIMVPGESTSGYGVYLFRKTFDIRQIPDSFIVHVSADNRYKLFVNEKLVSLGPSRGDMFYWNFETIDLTPYLVQGKNVVAAKVWNQGNYRPEAQISWQSGFILQGNTGAESIINTNSSWKCIKDSSNQPYYRHDVIGYFVTGAGEYIDMKKNMTGWNKQAFNDTQWHYAIQAYWRGGSPKGLQDAFGWMLVPSSIPPMELKVERLQSIRESSGVQIPSTFPSSPTAFTIDSHTKTIILLDQGYLTNAYPNLVFSNGKDASITLKYAEALFIPANSSTYPNAKGGYMGSSYIAGKGNRNEIKDKIFLGRMDSIVSDGTLHQEFSTLYWRTYRYIQLTIHTADDPLTIEDIYGTFTGYPFQMNAKFSSDNTGLQQILDIGWRTARLCAIETYMDCPYYEQLQYIGDARIQAMVSLYNSGDDRLVRNALNLMDHSRIAEGITSSRHPSYSPQFIPTFSLWYIGMLHDYWMYRGDSIFVCDKLSGSRQILDFFSRYQDKDGSLKQVPYWNFTDWVENRPGWSGGRGPIGGDGSSAILDLQLVWALQNAADLEQRLGMKAYAQIYTVKAASLVQTIKNKYWDTQRLLFADTPEKNSFSQHANALAILTGTVSGEDALKLARNLISDTTITSASIYFKYYLHQALTKAGLGNDYLQWLDIWHKNIEMGLTTWAEDSEINTARSDCHAWGASPNIEFYRIILGLDSDAPGFSKVRIEPHLGALKKASGSIPHPLGNLAVRYATDKGKLSANIQLPAGLTGTFIWQGKEYELKEGQNNLEL